MEDNVVLAYEVHKLGVLRLPPLLPAVRQQFHRIGYISYRRVEPYVEHLALCALHGHRNAPVEVSGDGARLQASVQPALHLAIYVRAPLLVSFEYPLAQPLLVILQRQVPVGCFLLHRLRAAELGLRVYELLGAEGASALLALVAVGILIAALRAGADYVTVSEEGLRLRVIVLFALLAYELAFVIKLAEEGGRVLLVHLGTGAPVNVEVYTQGLEASVDYAVIAVNYVLWAAALLACLDGDRHSVLIGAADEQHLASAQTQIAHIDVGRDIHSCQVADVDRPVGVWQGCGH